MLTFIAGVAAGIIGFAFARDFTMRRLRFVDGVRNPVWPWVVGAVAALVLAPIAWLLPILTGGTVAVFGVSTGLGTASGVKALKRGGSW